MARDRELQKLVNQAETERMIERKEALDTEREERLEAKKPKNGRLKPSRKRGAYLRLSRTNIGFLWWIGLSTALIMAPYSRQFWYVPAAMVVAFLVRVGFLVQRLRRDYPAFKRFPEGLRFKLDGGEGLIDNKLTDHSDWDLEDWDSEVTLRLTLAPGADEVLYDAVLELFGNRANDRRFYWAGMQIAGAASDPRKKWKRDGHTTSGSANWWVLSDLYALIYKLDSIHAKIGGIQRASFTMSGTIYGVSQSGS